MSNCVMIKPLPAGVSIVKVREVFSPFVTEKIIVKGGKAYIKFADAGDINSLFMKYDEGFISELGNAEIVGVPEDFSWALIDDEEKPRDLKTEDFILSQPKQEQPVLNRRPKFIVVAGCDTKIVDSLSEDYIKNKIFSKYRIGRVIKYRRDVYVQFLDENQIEILELQFPGLTIRELGGSAGPTDENFNYELVRSQVEKYQMEKEKEQKEREAERRIKLKQEADEKERWSRNEKSGDFSNWSIRPEGERIPNRVSGNRPQLFWVVVVALWGVYVMFM